ncbi:RraA family protein [Amycolatopsis pithecellobii]|uniref:Putative 4-hydroxy-4-methyl-2-oxoglutarate aldolase n=1 Tax=Amycolatopsis pithecellobii TaxID=664692 RepID=A0A6N7YR48_9PSEU|nr:RraA family protein [Amycolatopsis pithecellobii]MTD55497.1 RraA family protein [Amycolatopsis pithecellobii]
MAVTQADPDVQIRRLQDLDTCAVSDALDRLGLRGAIPGLRPLSADRVLTGRATTVDLGPARGRVRPARHLGTAAVDASGPGDVLVVAHHGRTDCAGWGGLLSRAAAARGVEGVVVDGAARDTDEAREAGLPVYGLGSTSVSARGRAVEVAWGEPVEFGGLSVAPGDLVRADHGGVVVIPADQADEVLRVAAHIAATEAAMAGSIAAGTPVTTVMGTNYEELSLDPDAR